MPSFPTTTLQATERRAQGYAAELDGLLLRIPYSNEQQVQVQSAPNDRRGAFDTRENAEDNAAQSGQTFSRSDFSGGSGLDFAHRRNAGELDRTRYWDSDGIDPFGVQRGERSGLKLLKAMTEIADTSGNGIMVEVGGVLLVAEGNDIREYTDILNATTSTLETAGAASVVAMAVLGDEVYTLHDGLAVWKRDSAGTWAVLYSNAGLTDLWAAKERIIIEQTRQLFDLAAGTPTAISTVLPSGLTFNDVTDGGSVVLASATNGAIYSYRDVSGTLTLQSESHLSDVDIPQMLIMNQGLLLIGTYETRPSSTKLGRVYTATVSDERSSFVLTDIQLILEFDTQSDATPYYAVNTRDSIYLVADGTEVWRYYLPTTGFARDKSCNATEAGAGIVMLDGRMLVGNTAGKLFREATTYESEGWLITAAADHFSSSTKNWTSMTAGAGNLDLAGVAEVSYSTDIDALNDVSHSTWTRSQTLDTDVASGSEIPFRKRSRWLAVKIRLTPNELNTNTPSFYSFSARSYPYDREFQVVIPVYVGDQIERPNMQPLTAKGYGRTLHEELISRRGQASDLVTYFPEMRLKGVVQQVTSATPIGTIVGSPTEVVNVVFIGQLTDIGIPIAGGAMLGTALTGVVPTGV